MYRIALSIRGSLILRTLNHSLKYLNEKVLRCDTYSFYVVTARTLLDNILGLGYRICKNSLAFEVAIALLTAVSLSKQQCDGVR